MEALATIASRAYEELQLSPEASPAEASPKASPAEASPASLPSTAEASPASLSSTAEDLNIIHIHMINLTLPLTSFADVKRRSSALWLRMNNSERIAMTYQTIDRLMAMPNFRIHRGILIGYIRTGLEGKFSKFPELPQKYRGSENLAHYALAVALLAGPTSWTPAPPKVFNQAIFKSILKGMWYRINKTTARLVILFCCKYEALKAEQSSTPTEYTANILMLKSTMTDVRFILELGPSGTNTFMCIIREHGNEHIVYL